MALPDAITGVGRSPGTGADWVYLSLPIRGRLAQLARAHASHAWGHWFESSIAHLKKPHVVAPTR